MDKLGKCIPAVSVVMPVYNGERFLPAAVESVLRQTMVNLELVCVEDGSTDASSLILENFAARDSRVRVLHTGGCGCSVARNTGMDAAAGKYIAFIDQDDLYHPQMLERMLYVAETYDVDIVEAAYAKVPESSVIESAFGRVSEVGDGCEKPMMFQVDDPFGYFIDQHERRGGGIVCPVWNRIFRRSAVADIRFPANVQPGEDSYFSYLVFDKLRTMAVVDDVLYAFRQNNASTSHNRLSRIVERFIVGRELLLRFWKDSDSPRREQLLSCASREMAWIVKEVVKRGDEEARGKVRMMLRKLVKEKIFLLNRLRLSKRIKTWLFLRGFV